MLVNAGFLFLLHGVLGLPLVPAVVLAVELTIVYNYLLHELWTFARHRPSFRRFAQFNLTALGALAVNSLCVWVLAGMGMYYLTANLVGIAAALTINFTLSTTWIWGERTNGEARPRHSDHGVAGADRAGHLHAVHDAVHLGPGEGRPLDRGARAFIPPSLSFTAIVPARHEQEVIATTMDRIARSDYPRELLQVLVVCSADDKETIDAANQKIEDLADDGIKNVELVVFDDEPMNKPHGLNCALRRASNDVVAVFDAEDEIHPPSSRWSTRSW